MLLESSFLFTKMQIRVRAIPKKIVRSKLNFSFNLKVFSGICRLLDLELKFLKQNNVKLSVTIFHHHGN